ncbi:butyrophilin subfamily 3 member A2-like isoform X3 [Gopherus flavomarginatus]|uniref:butyrophilin subfamily 3 member A2-like isoform X3 n=1 Tax=Gopherus flavomarginatus TaxID=286002 RepID=UPI0021CBF2A2|nr:butyrophilin subfamily 3 member A2-like isoform X3 [Gopherus flavomarginatus]
MKLLSLHHGSTGSISLPGFIVFFINLPIYNLVSAQFTVIGPDQPVTAIVGEDIVLPCHLSPAMSAENMEVRWSRSDYSSFVHRYRDGKDQTEYQIPEYTGRTEFLKDGIRNGSVALRLHNIRPMDEGRYACYFESTSFYNDAHMELEVAALGAAPLLSVEGYQDGGIRVVCRSAGWYPEPEVFWRDLTGQHVPLLSERTFQEANGLFETETSIIITETSNQNISCSIRSTLLKQEKESRIYIAELFFPKKSFWIAIPCTIMVIQFFVIGFLIYHLKTKEKKTAERNLLQVGWIQSQGLSLQSCEIWNWVHRIQLRICHGHQVERLPYRSREGDPGSRLSKSLPHLVEGSEKSQTGRRRQEAARQS